MKVYLQMFDGNIQQNPLCVESCVPKEFSISPRFSPTIFLSRCKFSTLTSTPLYSSRPYAQNPVLEIVNQESVKICTTGMSIRTLYAQHYVSIRIFTSLPVSRLQLFIAMRLQYSYEHTYVQHHYSTTEGLQSYCSIMVNIFDCATVLLSIILYSFYGPRPCLDVLTHVTFFLNYYNSTC